MRLDEHLLSTLSDLEQQSLRRARVLARRSAPARVQLGDRELVDFSSNDYLGFAQHPRLARALADAATQGTGGASSRLVYGTSPSHDDAERALANFLAVPSARLFSSAFAANVGILPALFGPQDLVLSDELNHASLIDGCRLSRARVLRYRHADAEHVRELLAQHRGTARLACIVTESIFSMDGDPAPLRELRALADAHDAALYLDEAHALGVVGPHGRGLAALHQVQAEVVVGGLGKAFGLVGGFVAGSGALCDFLDNKARSFVFSTATAPATAAVIPTAVALVSAADGERAQLHRHVAELVRALHLPPMAGGIVPVVVGDPERTLQLAHGLLEHGFVVPAIRPPTVPAGGARLRISCSAAHTDADIRDLVALLERHLGRHQASQTISP